MEAGVIDRYAHKIGGKRGVAERERQIVEHGAGKMRLQLSSITRMQVWLMGKKFCRKYELVTKLFATDKT